jgi:hypothetical protein
MQPKQRVSTPQGRVARHFGCQRVAAIEFLCAGRAMRRKVTPSSLGIRGMSGDCQEFRAEVGHDRSKGAPQCRDAKSLEFLMPC